MICFGDCHNHILIELKKSKINELQIGKIHTLKILVKKYSFPRVRNLPNKVICEDKQEKLIVFFLIVMKDILEKFYH